MFGKNCASGAECMRISERKVMADAILGGDSKGAIVSQQQCLA